MKRMTMPDVGIGEILIRVILMPATRGAPPEAPRRAAGGKHLSPSAKTDPKKHAVLILKSSFAASRAHCLPRMVRRPKF